MPDYFYLIGIAAVLLLAGLIVVRRFYSRNDEPEYDEDETGQIGILAQQISKRIEAVEEYVSELRLEIDKNRQESLDYMTEQEARVEQALTSLQQLLEERLPGEGRPYVPLSEEFTPKRKPAPLIQGGNERSRFLNDTAHTHYGRLSEQSTVEKNVKVRNLYRKGYTVEQIAQEMGASKGEVRLIIELDASVVDSNLHDMNAVSEKSE